MSNEHVTITVRDARRYIDALHSMASIETLPAKLHFKLARALRAMRPEIELSEDERRKLIIKHGKKNKDTDTYGVPDDNLQAFLTEWMEILNQEIEIPTTAITLQELESYKAGCEKITPLHTEAILFLVVED